MPHVFASLPITMVRGLRMLSSTCFPFDVGATASAGQCVDGQNGRCSPGQVHSQQKTTNLTCCDICSKTKEHVDVVSELQKCARNQSGQGSFTSRDMVVEVSMATKHGRKLNGAILARCRND